MENEIWKDIKGYKGLYQISNTGKVKRIIGIQCRKERRLNPCITKWGYFQTALSSNWRAKNFLIRRLVAKAFIPNPNNYPLVCHKDGNPQNNKIDNLYWGTNKMNQLDRAIHNTDNREEKNGSAKLVKKQVLNIRALYKTGDYTFVKLSKLFGVHAESIRQIVRKITWRYT